MTAEIIHIPTREERFNTNLLAERDALHERYDPPFEQRRIAREYERRVADDYPVGVRFVEEPRLYTRDEVMFALFIGVWLGALLTVGAAFVWSFWL